MAADLGSGIIESSFPAAALVPKAETGILNFLQKYPEFDGRDVTIAIFDSGVDPRATGLSSLCDGKTVKVIERFDCTGCGDVDVSKCVTPDDQGYLKGLSGRQLKVTNAMLAENKSANCEFRIGLKSMSDLCPSKIRETINNAAKQKYWDSPNKIALAEISRKITEFETENPDASKLSWDKKLEKENLESILELLNAHEKIYNDVKITYDVILYPTDNGWKTIIDITEKGDLENALHIGEYTKTHEVKNVDDYFSVSVNVHDEGNILEIVGMCSSHGTHVASIASGNHDSRETDGVAPNAKIVSMTIGDGRLGSMETGTALVRAMMKVMEMCREGQQIDVINMSYGEHSNWSNTGRIGDLMNEVVNKYGVVWVASAGNHGPALSTVGTPPDISQPSLVGVGAFVSPQMMEAEYAMREKLPGNVYTWTSRDPCIDGGQGVTVCAPGGAITSVPQFTMSKSQLMNGTSMAAPHVAGAIALLISGLKQRKIEYSPYSIKRAISVTANKLSYVDPFAQGHGLLNVEKAFEHLENHCKAQETMMRFSVRVGPCHAKGIHLRSSVQRKLVDYSVFIEPVFFNDKDVEPSKKYNFNVRLNLIPSQNFVQCGAFLDLSYGSRSLIVRVDPTSLPPGVHTAVIRAFDTANVQKGSLFEIPVTVVQPLVIEPIDGSMPVFQPAGSRNDGSIEFQPNTIQRDFLLVPNRATWAVLRLRSMDTNRDKELGKFFVHINQLLPKSSCRKLETMKIIAVNSEYETTLTFRVQANHIMELCIAKYWSNHGITHLKYCLEFHGIEAINPSAYTMHAGRGIHKLLLRSLVSEDMQPQIVLKTAAVVLKPTDAKISPLSATRDVIPEGRQIYQNILTYTLNVAKASEVSLHAPLFYDILYEAEYESQLWMLFDANKVLHATGDVRSNTFSTKLEKGEYTIKLQIRHEKREILDKISEATMIASFKLSSNLNIDFYDSYNQCIVGGRKFISAVIKDVPTKVLYLSPINQERINKANLPAQCAWLSGIMQLPKDESGRRVNGTEFTYILPHQEKKSTNGSNNGGSKEAKEKDTTKQKPNTGSNSEKSAASGDGAAVKSESEKTSTLTCSPKKNKVSSEDYAESLRDFQCQHITKCELENAEKIYNELIIAHPDHLVAHLLLLQNIESSELKTELPLTFVKSHQPNSGDNSIEINQDEQSKLRATLERIIKLADMVIKGTDSDALLAYYGLKTDTRADAAKIKTNMDKQKNTFVEALAKKGAALAKLSVLDSKLNENLQDLDNIYTEIIKFIDAVDSKVIHFTLWHAFAHNQYGRMYKMLVKLSEEKRVRENLEEIVLLADVLGYDHLKTLVQRMTVSSFPCDFRLF